tara:strand:- start:6003 stop:6464 length:462 start_codon:yes stop_codon:yes gene_type:complete
MLFQKIGDEERFEVSNYIKEYLKLNSDYNIRIYLGCDSHNKSYATNYVTTIVFHLGDSGCHVIYTKEKVDKIPVEEYWTRLWGETERSVEVALYLRAQEIEINTIGLDFNSDPNRKSNKLVKASIGYVESFGFKARIKPDILPAISAADGLAR